MARIEPQPAGTVRLDRRKQIAAVRHRPQCRSRGAEGVAKSAAISRRPGVRLNGGPWIAPRGGAPQPAHQLASASGAAIRSKCRVLLVTRRAPIEIVCAAIIMSISPIG